MIKAFTKIFNIGTEYIIDLFKEDVEITEKIDGSQFDFGRIEGTFRMRSKGKEIFLEDPEKMFKKAVEYVSSISHKIPDNVTFYCEYLKTPKHNVLTYGRVPKNNLILFGVSTTSTKFIDDYEKLKQYADDIDIEVVPMLYRGKVDKVEDIRKLLETESILGNTKIEGFVAKNYERKFLLGGQPMPLMAGKFVSEEFKEVHRNNWKKENKPKEIWQEYLNGFRTEARWQKATQHLKENGTLSNSPKDIGNLLKEVKRDIGEEEKENIKEFLWKEFGSQLLRRSTVGLPEWYKNVLLERSFENKEALKQ